MSNAARPSKIAPGLLVTSRTTNRIIDALDPGFGGQVGIRMFGPLRMIKPTSAVSGTGGKYLGRAFVFKPRAGASGATWAKTDLGDDPGADDCVLYNGPEEGKTTHDLTASDSENPRSLVPAICVGYEQIGETVYEKCYGLSFWMKGC